MPTDPKEASQKLASGGKHSHIIAGGTGFYELAQRGYIPEVKNVISIMKLGLDYVKQEKEQIRIGATTTLQQLLDSHIGTLQGLEAIGDALLEIRPVQIRNVATVGGEICISVPIVDLPTALLSCDAAIHILSSISSNNRMMKLDQFYLDAFLTRLQYGEIVAEVTLEKPKNDTGSRKGASAFGKIGRTAYDFNLVNVGVQLSTEGNKIAAMRVYVGGIKRVPIRALAFEKKLIGKAPEESLIADAAATSFAKENFLPSVHGSSSYKHELLASLLRECTAKALERISSPSSGR